MSVATRKQTEASRAAQNKEENRLEMLASISEATKTLQGLTVIKSTKLEPTTVRKYTPEILYNIALGTDIPPRVARALLAITLVVKESDANVEATAALIADNVLAAVNSKIEDQIKALESSLEFVQATSKSQLLTTCELKDSVKSIKSATESLAKAVTRIDEKVKVTPSPSSFAKAVRKGIEAVTTTQRTFLPAKRHLVKAIPAPTTAIRNCLAIEHRQILLDFSKNDPKALVNAKPDLSALRNSIDLWLQEASKQHKVQLLELSEVSQGYLARIKLIEGGSLLLEFPDRDSTDAFWKLEAEGLWKAKLCESAKITKRAYNVLAKFVPCRGKFDPGNRDHIWDLEERADLRPSTIAVTIRPLYSIFIYLFDFPFIYFDIY
jgi:hypothetical protein